METIYVVCWGHSSVNDDGNCVANCGVSGVFKSKTEAEECLKTDVQNFVKELVDGLDAEDREDVLSHLQEYGSVKEEYFEVDYEWADNMSEYRVCIEEKQI